MSWSSLRALALGFLLAAPALAVPYQNKVLRRDIEISNATSSASATAATSTASASAPIFSATQIGCYIDSTGGQRALDGVSSASVSMVAQLCAAACAKSKYFGLEYGDECWCGNTIAYNAPLAPSASECSMPCSGDANATCGGSQRIQIYLTPDYIAPAPATISGTPYLGCFQEAATRVLPNRALAQANMTAEICLANCVGYLYFGTEYGNECWCGNNKPDLLADATDCSMVCAGDDEQLCGGPDRLTVYGPQAIKQDTLPSIAGYAYQGCYSDSATARVLTGSFYYDEAMTLEMCATDCSLYEYFGVEYGTQCYCGTSVSNTSAIMPPTSCTMTCGGNSSETCGGSDRISLYKNTNMTTSVGNAANATGYTYSQCWTDSVSSRALTGASTYANDMTVEKCAAFCSASGYTIFGLEYATQCYCGNALAAGAAAPSSGCSNVCGGNAGEWCGGPDRLSIYVKSPLSINACGDLSNAVLQQGSFECGALAWTLTTTGQVGFSLGSGHESAEALAITVDWYTLPVAGVTPTGSISQTLKTQTGTQYTLGFWVKSSDGPGNSWTLAVAGEEVSGAADGADWTEKTVVFTATGGDELRISIEGGENTYGEFYFDSFVVSQAVVA
ncbi:hypothetical protein TD95_004681 [Thielaviopsis punctulata]|uniref:WSC domain-containing protein n=1 Tax=Thielaviopsis punctulata TaxID=72032 RepID=A0A0F4ZFK6_9PEZI|nr:hypothetical protein TD95_004681 [Thielaviopsis punctulata]